MCKKLLKELLEKGYAVEKNYDFKVYSKLIELGIIKRKWKEIEIGKRIRVLVPNKTTFMKIATFCEEMLKH